MVQLHAAVTSSTGPPSPRHRVSKARRMSKAENIVSALGLFTFERPEWTVEAAARELGLGLSTTYRYFKTLSDAGLIVAFSAGRYVLGPAITQLDRQTRLLDPLISAAKPAMQDLLRALDGRGILLLCRLYRDQIMCVHQEALEPHERAVSFERGRLMPLHRGAASKIVLAHLPARFVRAFYEKHAADMAAVSLGEDWDGVKRSMRRIRNAGYVVTYAEVDTAVTGIAAPVFDACGCVVGSLGAVLSNADLSGRDLEHIAVEIKTAARHIDTAIAAAVAGA